MNGKLNYQGLKGAVADVEQIYPACFEADIAPSDHLLELLLVDQLRENIVLLKHLRQLCYRQYWLLFCNIIK